MSKPPTDCDPTIRAQRERIIILERDLKNCRARLSYAEDEIKRTSYIHSGTEMHKTIHYEIRVLRQELQNLWPVMQDLTMETPPSVLEALLKTYMKLVCSINRVEAAIAQEMEDA